MGGVVAIVAGASEINNDAVRRLSKRLGIKLFNEDDEAYAIARNKRSFKDICISVGASVSKDYFLSDALSKEELGNIVYPVVIKPVDQGGNKGVSFCNNEEELLAAYRLARECSDNPQVICERRLVGEEWAVQYALAEGEARILMFGKEHHQPNENSNLYSFLNTTSHRLTQYMDEANETVIRAFNKAGFKDGIAWVEVMRDKHDGKFYIIECAHRMGSESLYALHNEISGFNSLRWLIEASFGKTHQICDLPENNLLNYKVTAGAYHLFAGKAGIVQEIKGLDQIEALSDVVIDIPRRRGYYVNFHNLMGEIRMKGLIDDVIEKLKFINETLKIVDEHGENMFIKFTDYDALKEDFLAGLDEFKG